MAKLVDMDRLFVTNIEDKEVLFESARDREAVRGEPPKNTQIADGANPNGDKQPV